MDILELQEELHLKDYINVLRRRRAIVILFFMTVVLVVTVGTFLTTPLYRAKTVLLIDLENPNVLTSSGMVELQSQNYFSYKEYYQSQKEILTSLPIVQKVFNEFKLMNTSEYIDEAEPIKKFLKSITTQPVRDTRLLELYVTNKNPELAAKIANRIAEMYVKRNLYYISKTELLNLLKNEYLKLEAKLSEYSKIYKESHPEMIRLKKEIDELVGKIEQEKKIPLKQEQDEEALTYKYALEGLKANNVSVLSPAEVPTVPVRPKKLVNIVVSVILGLFGGVVLAFIFEYFDDSVKEVNDVAGITKWPLLGSVPRIDSVERMSDLEKDMIVHIRPREPTAEAYRAIRTSIAFSSTEEHMLKALIVTSAVPQEGKTTTLCNLGIAMAQNRKRVLLVDADMRNPRLHEVFKKDNKIGLSTFLSWQESFENVVQRTAVENVLLVTSGIHPPNPSELLTSHKMQEFIEKAKESFDYILLDTPPIAILTDATILSSGVDGVVVVVEGEKTSKKALLHVFKLLENAKAKVVGFVFNKISVHNSNYYYHSYYYTRKSK